jgi:Protein of unknown function (DUF3626)
MHRAMAHVALKSSGGRVDPELRVTLNFHGGFRLSVAESRRYPDFRGPEYVRLGITLAEDGQLDPRIIGDASRTGRYDDRDLKRVWHYVARFGSPD